MAVAVRARILQSALEAMRAEDLLLQAEHFGARRRQRAYSSVAVRPPAASARAMFASSHHLGDNGRSCTRCQGSTSLARKQEWLISACFDLESVD
eukprot:8407638-Pyramimonas_sp.AAC.1